AGRSPRGEHPVVGARDLGAQLIELAGGRVRVSSLLLGAADPVRRRFAERPAPPPGGGALPPRGGGALAPPGPSPPYHAPQSARHLRAIGMVADELPVGGLRLGIARRALEETALHGERLRRLRTLGILAHEPVEHRDARVLVPVLLQARQIEEPGGTAVGRQL